MTTLSSEQTKSNFGRYRWILVVIALGLIVLGGLVRLKDISDAPVDILPDAQVNFLLSISRPDRDPTLPVVNYLAGQPNPPLLQKLESALVSRMGLSALILARMVSITGWLVAAILLFFLLHMITKLETAVIGMGMFLFLPYSIQFSRVVLPAAWVTALVIAALLCLQKWAKTYSWIAAAAFGLLGSLASLLEPAGMFLCMGGLLGVILALRKRLSRSQWLQVCVMAALVFLPRLAAVLLLHPAGNPVFALLGISGSIRSILSLKKVSRLELRVESIIGLLGIAFSVIGLMLSPRGEKKAALIGLWGGFLLLCAVQLAVINDSFYPLYPLILLVVFSFAPLVDLFIQRLSASEKPILAMVLVSLILLGGIGLGSLGGRKLASGNEMVIDAKVWQTLGERLGSNAVFFSDSQATTQSLAYFGGNTPLCLPGDAVCSQSIQQVAGKYPDLELYYLVEKATLEKDQTMITALQNFPLRCETGSGIVIIPLTANHPACSE